MQCHLAEDGRSALFYANWSADVPVFAKFVLPFATTDDEFDAEGYIKMCER
jgi:hypothetical protein